MTFQPPPGETPPPPPPGQWGPPPGGSPAKFDPKTVNNLDWGILGVGALLFIFSFFAYESWDAPSYKVGGVTVGGGSYSLNAWHTEGGTWIAWFAMILGVLGAVAVALELFVPNAKLPVPNRLLGLGLFAASLLLYLIAIFAHDDFGPYGSHAFGFWISLILAAGGTVLALMRLQQTGGTLPGPLNSLPRIGGQPQR